MHGRAGSEYIGRERDLAALKALLRTTASGRGGLVFLTGEAGIGKTRTCEELARAGQLLGLDTVWGRCWEAGGAPAYWPWMQILQTLLTSAPKDLSQQWLGGCAATLAPLLPGTSKSTGGGMLAVSDSPSGRFDVFRCVATVLERASATRPILILFDDLHGADEPSLLLLEFIARQLAELPIMIVAAYRDVAMKARSPLAAHLPQLLRERDATAVTIRPLDMVEVEELARKVTGQRLSVNVSLMLHRLTDGNPLFLLECLRAFRLEDNLQGLAEGRIPLPVGLRSAIARHLAPLSADCRSILRAGAVLGRDFGIVMLRRLIHYPDDVLLTAILDEAVAVEVLAVDTAAPGRYRFVHGLVREALYAELTGVEQLRYHHDAATLLAALPVRDPHTDEIAHHFIEAARRGADPEPAVGAALAAGDRALALFAYEEAERLYAVGLDVLEQFGPDDHRLHARVFLAHGKACNRLGEVDRAKQSFERAGELAQAIGARELFAEAALGYGGPLVFPEGGYIDHEYVATLERALALWKDDDHALHARLLARLATTLYFADAADRRRELCRRAVKMARAIGDPEALGQVLLTTHVALWGPNPRERLQMVDELLYLVRRSGNRALGFAAHHWRYCDLLELGDVARMENEFQACRALAAELREPAMLGWVNIFQTGRAMWEGRFDECERLANETLGLARWLGNAAQTLYFLQTFHLRVLQGRCDEMLEPMQMVAGLNPGIPAFSIGVAYVHVEADRIEEARPLAQGLVARLEHYPRDINYISTVTCLGLVCARIGDAALTEPVYELMRPYGDLSIMIGNGLGYCGAAAHWLGVMAASLERWDEATDHFERALRSEVAMGSPPWIANTQYEYAAMLRNRGRVADRARARELLEQASATAEALGMNRLSKITRRLLDDPATAERSTAAEPLAANGNAGANGASVFRREGDFWTIEHHGHTVRLRDSRGLYYVAHLLRHPHREFAVLDLVANGIEVETHGMSRAVEHSCSGVNGGEALSDRKALAQYRERIDVLRSELAEAEANNDAGRVCFLKEELDAVCEHLTLSTGLGGRPRRAGSDAERARSAVTKRIRDAVKRIQEQNPGLGRHLVHTIQTGYVCSYEPQPHDRIHWSF